VRLHDASRTAYPASPVERARPAKIERKIRLWPRSLQFALDIGMDTVRLVDVRYLRPITSIFAGAHSPSPSYPQYLTYPSHSGLTPSSRPHRIRPLLNLCACIRSVCRPSKTPWHCLTASIITNRVITHYAATERIYPGARLRVGPKSDIATFRPGERCAAWARVRDRRVFGSDPDRWMVGLLSTAISPMGSAQ
jgi:hypothetical protein